MATAVEAYAVDNNYYPSGQCTGKFTDITDPMTDTSLSRLAPTYIANPVKKDGWGHFFLYNTEDAAVNQEYGFISKGRDDVADTALTCSTTTNFNNDIVYSNGGFLQFPEGSQN
ncbi:MAG: type II secretion system protein GspG [Acidobacteriota bacterium]|nr:type II secretion system protein GspG [Acidobacteriota bacterium]MDQ5871129.1 type II secretion system protein GspG [Acidobacteriota bacterium]